MAVREIYMQMCAVMAQNPNSDVKFEADLLVEHVLGKKRLDAMMDEISSQNAEKLMEYANMRKEGYPLQYILGVWYFFDMELLVGEGVLIPRQDTETVCEAAFEVLKDVKSPTVIDLCSGSGCIALAIKKYFPQSAVTAVEKSDKAYNWLTKNIQHTSLQIDAVNTDLIGFEDTLKSESVDLVVSNPPYINPNLRGKLQTEVQHEPEMALFADNDGLYFYRYIATNYKKVLKNGGHIVFEYGFDQQTAVKNILEEQGYTIKEEFMDLGGNPRGVVAQKP